jgi:hypothetical protein
MLIIGYCIGIRSERRLCEEVHLNHAAMAVGAQRGEIQATSSTHATAERDLRSGPRPRTRCRTAPTSTSVGNVAEVGIKTEIFEPEDHRSYLHKKSRVSEWKINANFKRFLG